MIEQRLPLFGTLAAYRQAARSLLSRKTAPEKVAWRFGDEAAGLFGEAAENPERAAAAVPVPKAFAHAAALAICHDSAERFALPYKILWRLQSEPLLLDNPADADVARITAMVKSVRRDCHKMKAFVRFREVTGNEEKRRFYAWFEPEHFIIEHNASFFVRRFADMDWVIATPKGEAHYCGGDVRFLPHSRAKGPAQDDTEDLWRTYYANIFNPARLKVQAMKSEMPVKYWKNLPEAQLIPELIAGAAARSAAMQAADPSIARKPYQRFKAPEAAVLRPSPAESTSLEACRAAAQSCQRCPLHCAATQVVFGEGPRNARIMFVGEQPGDEEDLAGRPFVGPAGAIFDDALKTAGIARNDVYVTNAVKHFKFTPRGKRRLHQRPNNQDIQHCKWWLNQEVALIRPQIVVAMGATAVTALLDEESSIKALRGSCIDRVQYTLLVTYHPAAMLRNEAEASSIKTMFFEDIKKAAETLSR